MSSCSPTQTGQDDVKRQVWHVATPLRGNLHMAFAKKFAYTVDNPDLSRFDRNLLFLTKPTRKSRTMQVRQATGRRFFYLIHDLFDDVMLFICLCIFTPASIGGLLDDETMKVLKLIASFAMETKLPSTVVQAAEAMRQQFSTIGTLLEDESVFKRYYSWIKHADHQSWCDQTRSGYNEMQNSKEPKGNTVCKRSNAGFNFQSPPKRACAEASIEDPGRITGLPCPQPTGEPGEDGSDFRTFAWFQEQQQGREQHLLFPQAIVNEAHSSQPQGQDNMTLVTGTMVDNFRPKSPKALKLHTLENSGYSLDKAETEAMLRYLLQSSVLEESILTMPVATVTPFLLLKVPFQQASNSVKGKIPIAQGFSSDFIRESYPAPSNVHGETVS